MKFRWPITRGREPGSNDDPLVGLSHDEIRRQFLEANPEAGDYADALVEAGIATHDQAETFLCALMFRARENTWPGLNHQYWAGS